MYNTHSSNIEHHDIDSPVFMGGSNPHMPDGVGEDPAPSVLPSVGKPQELSLHRPESKPVADATSTAYGKPQPQPKSDPRDAVFNEMAKGSPDHLTSMVARLAGSSDLGKAAVHSGMIASAPITAPLLGAFPEERNAIMHMTEPQDKDLSVMSKAAGIAGAGAMMGAGAKSGTDKATAPHKEAIKALESHRELMQNPNATPEMLRASESDLIGRLFQ